MHAAELAAYAGAAVAAATVVVRTVRKVVPWLRRVGHLVDDLAGVPARPGHDARPGLMARVAAVEVAQRETRADLREIRGHLGMD